MTGLPEYPGISWPGGRIQRIATQRCRPSVGRLSHAEPLCMLGASWCIVVPTLNGSITSFMFFLGHVFAIAKYSAHTSTSPCHDTDVQVIGTVILCTSRCRNKNNPERLEQSTARCMNLEMFHSWAVTSHCRPSLCYAWLLIRVFGWGSSE